MDDDKVTGYINQSFDVTSHLFGISKLNSAWSWLYGKRGTDDPDNDDDELAAAEHYMYAPWQVASGGTNEHIMRLLTLGYDPGKLLGYLPPIWLARKLAGQSWARPSFGSIAWGMQGCHDGVKDKVLQNLQPQ